MHGSTLLRGKLAICHHRLTKHSSCGKLSERIDIAAVSSLSVTTDSPSTRPVARNCIRACEALQANEGRQSRRGGEREKRPGRTRWRFLEVNLVHTRLANQSLSSTSVLTMPASTIIGLVFQVFLSSIFTSGGA